MKKFLFVSIIILLVFFYIAAKKVFIVGEKQKVTTGTGDWTGTWIRVGSTLHDSTDLVISEATSRSFKFTINMQSGSHVDGFEGRASIKGNLAFYKDKKSDCAFTFILYGKSISLKKSGHCIVPMGCKVSGDYRADVMREISPLKELGIFETRSQEERFRILVGEEYYLFESAMQLIADENDLDQFGARVHSGFVRGMANVMAAIIMINAENKIWSAVLDNNMVYYYTNDPEYLKKLPKTIECWRENFLLAKVIYASHKKKQKK